MNHPIVINLGVGRSGTTFLHNALRVAYAGRVHVLHEDLHGRVAGIRRYFRGYEPARIQAALADTNIAAWTTHLRELATSQPVIVTGSTSSHLAPALHALLGEQMRTFHLHRHPLNVCAAAFVGAWGTDWLQIKSHALDPTLWILTPADPHVRFPQLTSIWPQLGAFGRMAYNWLERTAAACEFESRFAGSNQHVSLHAQHDVFNSDTYLQRLGTLLEREPDTAIVDAGLKQNAAWQRALEERPLGDAWQELLQLPEVVQLAASLGHPCEQADLRRAALRYQLPSGFGSWMRNKTAYWQWRRRAARVLRANNWLPHAINQQGGGAPRPTRLALAEAARFGIGRLKRMAGVRMTDASAHSKDVK